jgi:hypothetical protein
MQDTRKRFVPRWVAIAAIAIGVAGGSYGIATAASGNSGSTQVSTAAAASPAADPGRPWGGQRSDETLLSGDP